MENGSFSSDEFVEWSKNYVPFAHVTTHIKGRANDDMLGKVGGTGFPTLRVMNAAGDVVANHNGARSVEGFKATFVKIDELNALRKRVKAGEKELAAKLLLEELNMGAIKYAAAKKSLAAIKKIKPETKAEIEKILVGMEFNEIMSGLTEENFLEHAAKIADMARAGRIPGGRQEGTFWQIIASWADKKGDLPLLKKAFPYLEEKYGSYPQAKEFLDGLKNRIDELSKEGNPDA